MRSSTVIFLYDKIPDTHKRCCCMFELGIIATTYNLRVCPKTLQEFLHPPVFQTQTKASRNFIASAHSYLQVNHTLLSPVASITSDLRGRPYVNNIDSTDRTKTSDRDFNDERNTARKSDLRVSGTLIMFGKGLGESWAPRTCSNRHPKKKMAAGSWSPATSAVE